MDGISQPESARWHGHTLLQIPETCAWNPYVALSERHLASHGYRAIHGGLCRDEPGVTTANLAEISHTTPAIVHLHWPEKLAYLIGFDASLRLLDYLAVRGSRIVQTVHNLSPHESPAAEPVKAFIEAIDQLTAGVHFFSEEHERFARPLRPHLPKLVAHIPHPRYPVDRQPSWSPGVEPRGQQTMGCVGRLRSYKRTDAFAAAFLRHAAPSHRLIVAGQADDPGIDASLRNLAAQDHRLDYRPGFLSTRSYMALLSSVDWIALPYQRLWSSGTLVMSLEFGRRVLAPRPVGLDTYGPPSGWLCVEPWDDDVAMQRWRTAADEWPSTDRPIAAALPTWKEAAFHLAAFYDRILEEGPRTNRVVPLGHYCRL